MYVTEWAKRASLENFRIAISFFIFVGTLVTFVGILIDIKPWNIGGVGDTDRRCRTVDIGKYRRVGTSYIATVPPAL